MSVLVRTAALVAVPGIVMGVPMSSASESMEKRHGVVRVATYNVKELDRAKLDAVDDRGRGRDPQLRAAAAVVQTIRPDILVVNEIDFDFGERANARRFIDRYLAHPQGRREAIDYPHVLFLPTNTGVPSGLDLDRDGETRSAEDAWGFGRYPGQYGMALFSRLPIERSRVRTFRRLRWASMPGHLMPDGTDGKPAYYPPAIAARLRLSSKSHWQVPVAVGDGVGDGTWHLLVAHPTPPVFDGDEDRNGRRNFDEVRLIADLISGGDRAEYIVDDRGRPGGLPEGASFIVLGDLNADPVLGTPFDGQTAIAQLLDHPRVHDPLPRSEGAAALGDDRGRPYAGDRATRTARFGRADYVLPSRDLEVVSSGVHWPAPGDDDMAEHDADVATRASDHYLVWVDIEIARGERLRR